MEGRRNRTTISVDVPSDAGNGLKAVVLTQLPNIDQWDWGVAQPRVYFGQYSLRADGEQGRASASFAPSGDRVQINFSPEVQPGQTVNVVFRGFNPEANVYQWSVELWPLGKDPVRYTAGTLRTNVYDSDWLR